MVAWALVAGTPVARAAAPGPTLSVTTTSLPAGQVSVPYSTVLSAVNGVMPYSWSLVAGTLPPGLTLNYSGLISGTPSVDGTWIRLVFQVADAGGAKALSNPLSITIIRPTLAVTTTSLPAGKVQNWYSSVLSAVNGVTPNSWLLVAGTLPPGLTLNYSGLISGTPTADGTWAGLVFRVSDAGGAKALSSSLSITIIRPALAVTTTSLPAGQVQSWYSSVLSAVNGVTPNSWLLVAGTLPPGLTLNYSGLISGTPTAAGTWSGLVFRVSDAGGAKALSNPLSITINPGLAVTTTSLPAGQVTVPYSTVLSAVNGVTPNSWLLVAGTLPPGLTLNYSGLISGTPTADGTWSGLVFRVSDAGGAKALSSSLSITINPGTTPAGQVTVPALPVALGAIALLALAFGGRFIIRRRRQRIG